jgi:hypothetical protein
MSFFPNSAISIVGSPFPLVAEQIAGNDGTDLRVLLTDSSGQLKVLISNASAITTSISGVVEVSATSSPNTDSNPIYVSALALANYAPPINEQGTLSPLNVTLDGNLRTRDRSTSAVDDSIVTSTRSNQIELNFSVAFASLPITNTKDATYGSFIQGNGCATYSTGAGTGGFARGVSTTAFSYRPGHEWYCYFTAAWPEGGAAGSHQRIGPIGGSAGTPTDGFTLGYEGTVWGISQWQNGTLVGGTANVAPTVALSAFNGDLCDGTNPTAFTVGGNPVALNLTTINIFRIHGAWFGVAPITLEVFSPDGEWVTMNTFRFPNSLTAPYAYSTNWNVQVDVTNTTNATNLAIVTPCWGMGATDAAVPLNSTISNQTLAVMSRTVLTGYYSTASAYLNVGVDSGGDLFVDIEGIAGTGVSIAAPGIILAGIADGSGNKLTTNSTTYTAKHALDGNLLGTLGTAFSTAGFVDIKGADGNVFVRQATAANLNATVVGTGTFAVQTIAASYVPALNATGQVSVTNSATEIIAPNTSRQAVLITNSSATVAVFVGASGVTAITGAYLGPGASVTIPATSAFYGITAASTATVSYMELQ